MHMKKNCRPKLSVIILSYALDNDIYEMNCQCIESLLASESWADGELEILLIESNKQAKYNYSINVCVLIPEEKFGFHRFFNIGVGNTSGEYIAFCNNDIVFQPNWWTAIMTVKKQFPRFMCFSPLDRNYPMMAEEIALGKEYVIGWENKRHFAAWCFVWERKVIDIIGKFDEIFDFYGADDDELQTMHYYGIPNVLVTTSEVKHVSQVVTKKVGVNKYAVTDKDKYPLSEYELKRGYKWLWDDVRFYFAHRRFEEKWGNEWMRKRINRFLDRYKFLNISVVTRLLYDKRINLLLAKFTGVSDPKPICFKDN